MVGGGRGAFIGSVHRMAAALDGRWALTAGALSSTPEKALESARDLGLAPGRSYRSWREMLDGERRLGPGERIDAVAVVTPNATHFEVATAFAEAGIAVVVDKPMVTTGAHAAALREVLKRTGVPFMVTYNYSGYPMVRRAAELVRAGEVGKVRKALVEYHQGWLATPLEKEGHKQAAWRQDRRAAGMGGAIGDIGTHAENLLSTVTGLEIEYLCADLARHVPGRMLDDDASVLLRLGGGARAVLTASQVCIGEQNDLSIRVYGDKGSLAWRQEEPETLVLEGLGRERRILARGGVGGAGTTGLLRLPAGHPEGFIEAFANLYHDFAAAVLAQREGAGQKAGYPSIDEGARGVRFVEKVVESARGGGQWVQFA
jgi:predicted dehydrogenase